MSKRIIIVLLAIVLLLAGCSSAPKAPAYDPAVAALLADFDPAAGREQPYGLPPSYAPDEVWEAAQRRIDDGTFDGIVYTELHDTGLTRTEAAERRAEMELAGGYQCWEFRENRRVLRARGELFRAIAPENRWCWLLFFRGTPVCAVELDRTGRSEIVNFGNRYREQMLAALPAFAALYSDGEAQSPVMLCLIGKEGENTFAQTMLAAVKTPTGGRAAVSSYGRKLGEITPALSCTETTGGDLLRYEQQRVRHWGGSGKNLPLSKREPYWRMFTPRFAGTVSAEPLRPLALGFGVWFALLLAATIGMPALMRRRG